MLSSTPGARTDSSATTDLLGVILNRDCRGVADAHGAAAATLAQVPPTGEHGGVCSRAATVACAANVHKCCPRRCTWRHCRKRCCSLPGRRRWRRRSQLPRPTVVSHGCAAAIVGHGAPEARVVADSAQDSIPRLTAAVYRACEAVNIHGTANDHDIFHTQCCTANADN